MIDVQGKGRCLGQRQRSHYTAAWSKNTVPCMTYLKRVSPPVTLGLGACVAWVPARRTQNVLFRCGKLLSHEWLLTALHCGSGTVAAQYSQAQGSASLHRTRDKQGTRVRFGHSVVVTRDFVSMQSVQLLPRSLSLRKIVWVRVKIANDRKQRHDNLLNTVTQSVCKSHTVLLSGMVCRSLAACIVMAGVLLHPYVWCTSMSPFCKMDSAQRHI